MMPDPKCPFCATEASKHEAGRCLDHWVEVVKFNKGRKNPAGKEEEAKFLAWAKDNAKPYSEDMNHAMTLWPRGLRLTHELVGVTNRHPVWKVSVPVSGGGYTLCGKDKDPATAICRAYLEVNND